MQRLDEAVKDFSGHFDRVMRLLKEQGGHEEEIARFLTFRLDYNEFYSSTFVA